MNSGRGAALNLRYEPDCLLTDQSDELRMTDKLQRAALSGNR